MLQVCTGFEYLPEALRKLPREGLYRHYPIANTSPPTRHSANLIRANFPE